MLQAIRDRASGWIAYVIVGLLIIPFALWGVHQYAGGGRELEVAKIGDTTLSTQEFQRAYQQHRLRIQSLLGDRFNPSLFDEDILKREVLEQLVNENVLLQVTSKHGFRVSDRQLHETIRSYEVFQQDGVFNLDLYQRVLRAQGYVPTTFEESLRQSLMADQLRQGVIESSIVTPADLDQVIGLVAQQRELTYVLLPLDNYLADVVVDDAAIEAYFQENQQRFMKPQRVKIEYLELDINQVAEEVPVTEDALRMAYQEQITRYVREEERSASHILIRIDEQAGAAAVEQARTRAQGIYEAIASGSETFQQVLQEAADAPDIEGGELGRISEGMLDPAFEGSLFALEAVGDISEPVRTPFGFHIIRLDGITPKQVQPFEAVRDEVAQDVRQRHAEARFYEMVETLSNLSFEHPDSLEPAAQTLGLAIKESPWITPSGGEDIAAYPQVVAAAFDEEVLQRGLNSEPIEIAPHHVVVIRAKGHQQATPLTLEEARDDVIQELRFIQARDALNRDGEALKARAEQGETLQALAEEFKGEMIMAKRVGRRDDAIDAGVLAEAFRLPVPAEGQASLGLARLANGDQAVIAVTQVVPGKVQDLQEAERQALEDRLRNQAGAAQFGALLDSLRERTRVVIHSDRL